MANPEHVEIVRKGAEAIREWKVKNPRVILDLSFADLRGANLIDANLNCANLGDANLAEAELIGANLSNASLSGANLSGADLRNAILRRANLSGAALRGANLSEANLSEANLSRADLIGANLSSAILGGANLIGADLRVANLSGANLSGAYLSDAYLDNASLWATVIADIDLRAAKGLGNVNHRGRSYISSETLNRSHGQIPDEFLQGCGFQPWEILNAKMYDPTLTPNDIAELQIKIFEKRTHGPLFIGGVFISYSLANDQFVDRIYARFKDEGAPVWLDRHDIIAGPIQEQIATAIRINDAVLLVLSEASANSYWVENELEMALEREKREERNLLCPIEIDKSWEAKLNNNAPSRVLWRKVKEKKVLDFSPIADFEASFAKLLRGLKIYYEPKPK